MKTINILIAIFALVTVSVSGQATLSAGMGYTGGGANAHGIVLELERDKVYTEGYSLPTRLDVSFMSTKDYYASSIDIHKGFRRNFSSGLVLEQSIGIGYLVKNFKEKSYWYINRKEGVVIPHGNTPVGGLLPSVTFGAGYNLSSGQGGYDLLWVRPKVYWDLGTNNITAPYFTFQAGYTHSINTK